MPNKSYKFKGLWPIVSVLLLFGVVVLAGCSHTEANPNDPDALYNEAEEAFKDERYLIAIEKYRDIKNRFPYSPRATDAELRIADSYFAQESYLEAESAYQIFKELHPTHPRGDYVQYQIGLSYFHQIPSNSTRDLSAAHRAIDAFNVLITRFSSSKFVEKARGYLRQARMKLAEYENYVAEFYFERKHYLSASYRYAALLQDFPDLGYDEEALYRLGRSYYHVRMYANAKDALRRLVKRYPNSGHRKESLSIIGKIEKKQ